MTISVLDAPRFPVSGGLFSRIGQRIGSGIRAVQHARMIQAMSELSDEQLAAIGLSRSDIPAHARACVYGSKA